MITVHNRHRLLLRVSAVVGVVVSAKLAAHFLEWEVISINPLFSGIVAANAFLMGFLLSGVLSDFKESERLPGELGACLENLTQEVCGIRYAKPEAKRIEASGRAELDALSAGLAGRYIPAGPGNDPIRNPEEGSGDNDCGL